METKTSLNHKTPPAAKPLLADVLSIEDLEGEIWNDVFGFDGLFSVSNLGRVKREMRTTSYNRVIQEKIISRIYCTNKSSGKKSAVAKLNYENKRIVRTVASLVVESFIRPLNDNECAIHIDKNRLYDDSLINVKIGTYSDSVKDDFKQKAKKPLLGNNGIYGRNKIIEQLDINGNVIREFISMGEIERVLGFKKQAISMYLNNKFPNGRQFKNPYGFDWRFKHIS
jgi:hypothetical protein